MSAKSRFRIRGLAEVPVSIEPKHPSPVAFKTVDLADLGAKETIPWHKAVQAVPAPHIWQMLYGYDQSELGKLWPSLAFLNSRAPRPIKETPLALAEFLDDEVKEPGLRDIPVYNWMAEAFRNDSRYRSLQQFYTPGVYTSGKDTGFDGAEMTLFVWRELVESLSPPSLSRPTVEETIQMLRTIFHQA
jgi:hypothetical protein